MSCNRRCHVLCAAMMLMAYSGCSKDDKPAEAKAPSKVTELGTVEVTARLLEIPGLDQYEGKFPPNGTYDYVYVVKYEVLKVHRGELDAKEILVGHYNPLIPRKKVADDRTKLIGEIGGSLRSIRQDDVHHLALDAPLDEIFMGGIYNEYSDKPEGKGVIYWAAWADAGDEK